MNTYELIETIIQQYEQKAGKALSEEDLGPYTRELLNSKCSTYKAGGVLRKTAARIIFEFLRYTLKEPDADWGKSRNLKDIYDCRVCANPIAQVYEKGLLSSRQNDIFGLDDILSDDELIEAIGRLMNR